MSQLFDLKTKLGSFCSRQPKFDPAKDLADLTGKVAIVTGGNSGIGLVTVEFLARRGAKVYVAARNEERAKAAIERIRAKGLEPGKGELEWLELNLSDPRKAKESAETFLAKEDRLDILVNNAGIIRVPYKVDTTYGIQEVMLVNHVSPFVFTKTLLPLLKQTAKEPDSDVRVVLVGSNIMKKLNGHEVHFRDVNDFNEKFSSSMLPDLQRYSLSKLANTLFAKQLQRRLDFEGIPITVMSLHPGTAILTEGVKKDPVFQLPVVGPILLTLAKYTLRTPTDGANVIVFAAASPTIKAERDRYKGAYLEPPGKVVPPPAAQAESKQLAEELWNTTEAILKTFDL